MRAYSHNTVFLSSFVSNNATRQSHDIHLRFCSDGEDQSNHNDSSHDTRPTKLSERRFLNALIDRLRVSSAYDPMHLSQYVRNYRRIVEFGAAGGVASNSFSSPYTPIEDSSSESVALKEVRGTPLKENRQSVITIKS